LRGAFSESYEVHMPSLDSQAPAPSPRNGAMSAGSEAMVLKVPCIRYSCQYSVFDHRIQLDEPTVRSVSLSIKTHALDTAE
jgi:hypothetical protein